MKYFESFRKSEGSDQVVIGVVSLDADGNVDARFLDVLGSDAALSTKATALKKTAWDEDVICAAYGLARMPMKAAPTLTPVALT